MNNASADSMKLPLFILAGCFLASVVTAQNLSIAKDQAKRAAGQTPAAQNPSAAQPPPISPALAATMQNIAGLRADFAVLAAGDAAAAGEQKVSLLNHLAAAAQGTKASTANVRKLADDFMKALAGHKKITPDAQKLASAVHALFNGVHLTEAQQTATLNAVEKMLTEAGASTEDAAIVVADLKAVAAETK